MPPRAPTPASTRPPSRPLSPSLGRTRAVRHQTRQRSREGAQGPGPADRSGTGKRRGRTGGTSCSSSRMPAWTPSRTYSGRTELCTSNLSTSSMSGLSRFG
ncbi:hypothetical protein BMF94_6501 [Rhodotorula taiwanensis]|uniref:Uncharacterized protein n=1 Tax=Rhodotorula taiwanensis TaxID=741276 RepID=A0A2S5B0X8_9BASI|nr:hypothetical protein BMF94_6501 [Rhodotorula taiwanensis]